MYPQYEEAKAWYAQEYGDACEVSSMPLPDIYDNGELQYARKCVGLDVDNAAIGQTITKANVEESVLLSVAFGMTLSKYSAEEEVLYTVGMTHLAYHNLAKTPTVAELLQRTKQQSDAAREHSCYTLADAATDLGLSSTINFACQDTAQIADMPGIEFLFVVTSENGEHRVCVEYQQNKYSEAFIDGFCATYQHILNELCRKECLADVTSCDEVTIERLDSFNLKDKTIYEDSQDAYQSETILSLFKKSAAQYPDNVAAVFEEKRYTYRELDELTDKIGAVIFSKVKDCGKAEPVVSILIPRNEYMFILPLAAMKAGCAYQPLDPSYPQERLNFMVKDADAALLIADENLKDIVNEYEGEVVLTSQLSTNPQLSTFNSKLSTTPQLSTFNSKLNPSSLLILLYTSGSTGVPKGVMLEHRQVLAYIYWYHHTYEMTPASVCAAYASFGFDANMMDMYSPLTMGATLCIIPEDKRLDLVALRDFMNDNHVTITFMTTQVGQQFALNVEGCTTLKHLTMGGEKMMSMDPHPEFALHNIYGPTECSVAVTHYEVSKYEHNIPVGSPTTTTTLKIVDKHMHRLPVGAPGELWASGPQVGRGYLNQPERTAEVFVEHEGKRWYRTGDIVRYREDGYIEFVGRKDGQVKIRGFRIELKEVETVIRDYEGIKDVTVQAFDYPDGGKYIAAYIVSDTTIDVNALNNFILDQKPPYMVPAVTMQIDSIPLTINQKVDKRALPKPSVISQSSTYDPSESLTPLQAELKAIVASIVNTDCFSTTDILGYVGLTSITGIKLASIIYKKYGVQVNSKALSKTSSLQSIESEILEYQNSHAGDAEAEENATEILTSAPLSFSQLGVYAECMSHPDDVLYNLPFCLHMPEGVTTSMLKDALANIIAAHPYVNICFKGDDNGNTIQCQAEHELCIPVLTLTDEQLAQRKKDFIRPFALDEGPLYRFEITECPSGIYLLFDFHHLIMDGGSVDMFLNQLGMALDGQPIEKEKFDYFHFANGLKIDEATEQFFASQIGQVEESSELIPDCYDGDGRHMAATVTTPANLTAVAERCRQLNITPAAFYLAALMVTVSKYTAEDAVGICTISNGRSDLRLADSFGMFVNTLPLVRQIDIKASVDDYLKQVSDTFEQTIEHENYPFAKIVENYSFKANIMYAYQVGVLNSYCCSKGELQLEDLEDGSAKFPVQVFVDGTMETGGRIGITYDECLYTEAMMKGFVAALSHVAEGLLSHGVVGDLSCCDAEMATVLDSFNATTNPVYPYEQETILSLFQKSAQQHPDNVAAVFEEKRYTYRELDELTDKIGSIIYSKVKDCGKSEPVVAILIPRNEYMFILPLAVMKAGCAYEPLDPSYPQERLNYMVKDADAALLIADEELKDIVNEYKGEVVLTSQLSTNPQLSTTPQLSTFNSKLSTSTPQLSTFNSKLSTSNPQLSTFNSKLNPSSLLILLYTSGSTGVPKGVMLEHRQVLAYVYWYQQNYQMTPESVCAAYASFGFDANMMDQYPPLTLGATLCVIPESKRLDLAALRDFMNDNRVTIAFMTTQVAQQFALNVEGCETLKHLSMGGEKMMSMDPHSDFTMHNLYGPTECSVAVTHYEVSKNERNIPIGKPTVTTTLRVMDKSWHRLPVGAPGELWASGPQVSRGYLNQPEKTAEVFVEHDGRRWYRTGDIVRYREDGNIEFVGRKDGQVKIRGFRIELKEVEAVIRDFDGVKDVTVQAYTYEDGSKYIAAFVVFDGELNADELNAYIKTQKPPYMVPTVTMQIDMIPLNVNQKVDKKALPKPEVQKSQYVAPANDQEKDFCNMFEAILGSAKVSATDDFFEIGGSSIVALKLIVAANKAGYDIVYNDIFDHTSPRALAEFVASKQTAVADAQTSDAPAQQAETAVDDTRSYIGPDGFDYRPLNAMLKQNTLEAFKQGERQPIGDVLLTGATGFLGIHVLYDLVKHYDNKVYCFVRSKNGISGEQRLKTLMFYYFSEKFDSLFGQRIFVMEGDAMNQADIDTLDCPVQTVVNCAACVKHFAKGNEIENMNVGSVRNLIGWCLSHDARLVHVSTGSVGGMTVNGYPAPDTVLKEDMFYFGQDLSNQYVHSKFMAERLILEAIAHHNLNAKIMRVGNLAPRDVDGEFQINFRSNNFMSMLAAFQFMGMIPYEMLNTNTEFSPIDATAHTMMLLAQTPKECIVLHAFNVHRILLVDVIRELENYGRRIEMVEYGKFVETFNSMMDNPDNIEKLRSLMAYDSDSNSVSQELGYDSSYTSQILYRMNYCWPITTWNYVAQFIRAVGGMGLFEINE